MSMRIALTRATVVGPAGQQWESVTVLSRNGTLSLHNPQGGLIHSVGVLGTTVLTAGSYTVETTEGDYAVTRLRAPCGCGK